MAEKAVSRRASPVALAVADDASPPSAMGGGEDEFFALDGVPVIPFGNGGTPFVAERFGPVLTSAAFATRAVLFGFRCSLLSMMYPSFPVGMGGHHLSLRGLGRG